MSFTKTNADKIRAMTDEELCRFLEKWVRDDLWARDWGERLWWLQQPCEEGSV